MKKVVLAALCLVSGLAHAQQAQSPYVAGEPTEAVPADVIELANKADATALVLVPGRYRVVARSRSGQVQEFELKR